MVIDLRERFSLLQQAVGVMRKLTKLRKDGDTRREDGDRITAFISSVVSSELKDGEWLGDAAELLGEISTAMGTQQVQNTYGLDLEVFRGSSPNLNDLEPEVLREVDGEVSPLETSAEIVMVIGGNVEEMAGLGLDEIEDESIPDLTLGTQSSDYGNDSLGLSLDLEEFGEDWFG